jgi:hypothetical protein
MDKPMVNFEDLAQSAGFLAHATKCPVCFQETKNRVQLLNQRGEVVISMPCCSDEHMAVTMKNVMAQLDPETRKHVKLQFSNLN